MPCALDQGEEPPTHCQKLSNDPQRKSFAEAMIFYHFLDRYGYINYEFKPNHVDEGSEEQETAHMVLFVGSGASGLATSMQLTKFGVHVTIVEGRERTGGRAFGHLFVASNSTSCHLNFGQSWTGTQGNAI